ncbi:hypothetical protein [Desulfobaculum bizertense]|uniref:Uncharacterized protein n=1 Tax=Desulfobaculum bizertense DSM 18034 TaxID=1121442 RepID=A0A1T4W2Z8_9BACT|nr:hypothetical protein [Desulfobaculum bizertense]SKA71519.1 hypothetical protein SAMN02745702_01504 [Desulfobaculum bizertense DSM 18034]
MSFSWENAFCNIKEYSGLDPENLEPSSISVQTLEELKRYLDFVHIKYCLLKPYFESSDYPLVEARELLPSFESDMFEYGFLPGFSMVALSRPLNYFSEPFQFDILHDIQNSKDTGACPLEQNIYRQNLKTFLERLPKPYQDEFRKAFNRKDFTDLSQYPRLLPKLLSLDRAHVMAKNADGRFHLAGIYASFPSDLDTEIKRFGLRIKKFRIGDNAMYERNRNFVFQFLMELYGYPIVSERRTSSALFARRLHAAGEKFLIRALGQSDRTLTSLYSHPSQRRYPRVQKIALVQVDEKQKEALTRLGRGRYFVDKANRVVILRVTYRQHGYSQDNIRQDRALSVLRQEIIHPYSGRPNPNINLLKDATNLVVRLNDITKGEYQGRTVYKRNEVVENTDSHEKRLKFLFSWLSKHQRRIIAYSDEFYSYVVKVLDTYLLDPDNSEVFNSMNELFQEVWSKYSYIQQARKAQILDELQHRNFRGKKISYQDMLVQTNAILHELKFEIVNYFDQLVQNVIGIGEHILSDPYLVRSYIRRKDEELTPYGLEIKKNYGRLVSLVDEFKAIRKSRSDMENKELSTTE